ncbi:putative holin [Arsenophonus sp. PmNCSU2021_1]|uniref:putative holin n=1 Tax=Arsenophonus sp. PmNCSU2021_1 TaxID=3118989 RepID=UPI002FF2DB6D
MPSSKKFSSFSLKKPRLSGWLITAAGLLVVIGLVSPQQLPVVLYKLSLITLAAVAGYWLDRSLFPKARPGQYLHRNYLEVTQDRHPVRYGCDHVFAAAQLRRAIIVAAVCLSVAMGL